MVARLERAIEVGAAIIGVSADSGAEVYAGLDGERLARARFRDFDRVWMEGVMGRKLAWSLVAYPTEGWAREALGEPDVDRLWDAFAHALRLDEPDPSAAWRRAWTSCRPGRASSPRAAFTALRYRGPGTDLEVGLIEGAHWLAGRERTVHGQVHAPNLPTEEVFTSPHRERAEGTVRSTMPLALRGTIVEGLELRLAAGEIVEARARAGRGRAARRARHRRRRAPLRRGRAGRRLLARRRDRRHLQQHALRRERRGPHRLGQRAAVGPGPRARGPAPGRRASTTRRPTRTSWSARRRSRSTGSRRAARPWPLLREGIWQL